MRPKPDWKFLVVLCQHCHVEKAISKPENGSYYYVDTLFPKIFVMGTLFTEIVALNKMCQKF